MSDLIHLFKTGQKVRCKLDGNFYSGTVKEIFMDHIIVDIPEINDHCWFGTGINIEDVFPDYNFEE